MRIFILTADEKFVQEGFGDVLMRKGHDVRIYPYISEQQLIDSINTSVRTEGVPDLLVIHDTFKEDGEGRPTGEPAIELLFHLGMIVRLCPFVVVADRPYDSRYWSLRCELNPDDLTNFFGHGVVNYAGGDDVWVFNIPEDSGELDFNPEEEHNNHQKVVADMILLRYKAIIEQYRTFVQRCDDEEEGDK